MRGLTPEQVGQFEEQGFLLVKGLLDPVADLDPVIEEYQGVLDDVANLLVSEGALRSAYPELPFGKRLARIQQEGGRSLVQHFDFSLPQSNIKADTPIWLGPAVFKLLSNERMLDAVESLIGPEIYSNPVQHVRLKPPESAVPEDLRHLVQLSTTPWHQDSGVVTEEADGTDMITVWFPLWDAPISAGPLQVVPQSHRNGLFTHCPGSFGVRIPQQLLDYMPALCLPMRRGDALFMHKLTAHSSLPNKSENIRWSFDLRYNPIGQHSGRDAFPGFVARSRKSPQSELHDADVWADRWREVRARLATEQPGRRFNRWDASAPVCA